MKFKFKPNRALIVIVLLIIMSVYPGTGDKMSSTNFAVASQSCVKDTDCAVCIGSGLVKDVSENSTFLGSLNTKCVSGVCVQSSACAVWSCGSTQTNCKSISQSLLDNTIVKLNNNPIMYILLVLLIIAYIIV